MKYKVRDRVRIKTRDQMTEDFGLNSAGSIACLLSYVDKMESELLAMKSDRIVTVKEITDGDHYKMEVINIWWSWSDDMIEGLVHEPFDLLDSIENRFELMDFDE